MSLVRTSNKKWWEALQYKCPSCKNFNCFKLSRETKKHYYKKCSICGFERKQEIHWGEWKMKGNKTFLRSNKQKKYIEVELRKFKSGLKIIPVENKLL